MSLSTVLLVIALLSAIWDWSCDRSSDLHTTSLRADSDAE